MTERESKVGKFAFIGPASVGKSTMTGIFRNRFSGNPHVAILEEGAHLFFLSHPDIADRSVSVQEQIQNFVLKREQSAYKPEIKLIISDRSVLDPVVYAQIYDTTENASRLLRNVGHWLPTYTSFILLDPSGVPYETGPFRRETPAERLAIHDAFREFCVRNNLPVIEVSGSLQERADKVNRVIYEQVKDKTIFEKPRDNYWPKQV